MFGQSILTIVSVSIALVVIGICLASWCLKCVLKFMEGPLGKFQEWHMTIKHGAQPFSPEEYWAATVAELETEGAKLIREWNSHAATGDRISREYRLNKTMILLELDRWNGFTLSGEQLSVEPMARRIIANLDNVSP